MCDWYYLERGSIRDETVGPIDTETLAKRIRRGEIKPDTPVSSPQKTGNKWVTITAFPKLVEIHAEGERARTREREREKEAKKEERERQKQAKKEAKVAAKQKKVLIKQQEASGKLDKQRQQTLAQRNSSAGEAYTGELLPPQPGGSPVQADAQGPVIQQPTMARPQPQQVNVIVNQPTQSGESNTVAVLLNIFLFPGLGQLVQGRAVAGIVWMFSWVVSLILIFALIGLFIAPLVWILAIVDAATYRG